MTTEDQAAVVELLASPATHGVAAVERIDTHSAIVFLAGARAYKLKRAVLFDYLDFSTVERRRAFCEAEVRLNRRTAPAVYRGIVPVVRTPDGAIALGGAGTPVDWVIEMNRFPQEDLFDRLAETGRLDLDLMPVLADAIAVFHAAAERRPDHGGRAGLAWVIDGNAAGFDEYGSDVLDQGACLRVTEMSRGALDRFGGLLEARREAGSVRQCHGDLHLRNIVLLDGSPTLFDAVEFDDRISCTDVLYDLAFLLMDLWRRRLPRHANAVWNRYQFDMRDLRGVPLMPLFQSCRAAVRAKTSATAASLQDDAARRRELQQLAREYLEMAGTLLAPPPPCLVAIGGLSGSGKSTLARGLAPAVGAPPGALVHRSDEIRKQLCKVPLLARLGPEGYSADTTRRVYSSLAERASLTLQAGCSTIVDAVYARAADREAVEALAADASVPFVGFWLEAPEPTLTHRVAGRRNDPSDADADVIRMQHAQATGVIAWHLLDASLPPDIVLRNATSYLARQLGGASNAAPDAHRQPVM